METKLTEPCPFCRAEPDEDGERGPVYIMGRPVNGDRPTFYRCLSCGAEGPKISLTVAMQRGPVGHEAAREAWNTRPEPTRNVVADVETAAKIIDPDAWHETLLTDGCGLYWTKRRCLARNKAIAIAALSSLPSSTDERIVAWLRNFKESRPPQTLWGAAEMLADAIERGEHRTTPEQEEGR